MAIKILKRTRSKQKVPFNFSRATRVLIRKLIYKKGLASRPWYYSLEIRRLFTQKVKVGFGPVGTGEDDMGTRKWRIDAIVNQINRTSERYSAGVFFHFSEMRKFDITVIVMALQRNTDALIEYFEIERLQKQGKFFIFDIVDTTFDWEKDGDTIHVTRPDFFKLMDGVIASSPLQIQALKMLKSPVALIEHQVMNSRVKDYTQRTEDEIKIIFEGYTLNASFMERIHPVIQRLRGETGRDIRFIYYSRFPPKKEGFIEYRRWSPRRRDADLADGDIAVTIKPLDDLHHQTKPSTKVLGYMAAGLPVVCTPSAADKLVIEHGKTGFFAYTDEEWYRYLKKLIENPLLRAEIGKAAHDYAVRNYNIDVITRKYLDFLDAVKEKERFAKGYI